MICEVRNTFGEHHHYLLHNDNHPYQGKVKGRKTKRFHVSPFISMDAEYQFTFAAPSEKLSIVIDEYQLQKRMLIATQVGQKRPVTTRNLLEQFFRLPLLPIKIMLMIHWQAFKIWRRGGTFYSKPQKPTEDIS